MGTYCKAPVVLWTISVFTWIIKLGVDQILLAGCSVWLVTPAHPSRWGWALPGWWSTETEQFPNAWAISWGSEPFPEQCKAVMQTSARTLVWVGLGNRAPEPSDSSSRCWERSSPLDIPALHRLHCSEIFYSCNSSGAEKPQMSSVAWRNWGSSEHWAKSVISNWTGVWTTLVSHVVM